MSIVEIILCMLILFTTCATWVNIQRPGQSMWGTYLGCSSFFLMGMLVGILIVRLF